MFCNSALRAASSCTTVARLHERGRVHAIIFENVASRSTMSPTSLISPCMTVWESHEANAGAFATLASNNERCCEKSAMA
eukprot:9824899-Lingulodinium_polyedra.AAC.1